VRGHLRKRAEGTWTIVVDAGRDPVTGKRRQLWRTVKGNKRKAQGELARLIASIETGTDLNPATLKVGDYFNQWLEAARSRVAPRTHERYGQLLRLHASPLGSIPMTKLRPLHLERLYSNMLESGLSAQTVLHVHRVVFASLRQAVRWQLVSRNVAEAVTPPRPSRKHTPALEPQQAMALIHVVANTDLAVPVVLAIATGMRRGEILGLRWQDVDLGAARLRVTQTLQETAKGLVFTPPKTPRSKRTVSLPAFAVVALKAHRARQGELRLLLGDAWQETGLVVSRQDGSPLRPSALSRQFRVVAKTLGIDSTFHGLRHGHASLMLAAGVHIKVVSDRLGHSTISTTADLYSHVAPALEEKAAASLDRLLAPDITGA
jgi:integrase